MAWLLGISLLLTPLLEIWLLIRLSVSLGCFSVWCVLTAGVGWYFARRESLSFWTELVSDVQNGRVPTLEGVDTMLVLLGGWGLIVPGFLSDLLGAIMLVPPFRNLMTDTIRRTLQARFL